MPDGDDIATTVESALRELADLEATGCLLVRDELEAEAEIYLRSGLLYSISVPGTRPQVGVRLMAGGYLAPEALEEALQIQRTELQGWRLGELLVHLGYVDRAVVVKMVGEQLRDALVDVLDWPGSTWRFKHGKRTRLDIAPPRPVGPLLDEVAARRTAWSAILAETGGARGVPVIPSGVDVSPETVLDPASWAVLSRVDGILAMEQLAASCGSTLFETGEVVLRLVRDGLLSVEVPGGDEDAIENERLAKEAADRAVREEAERIARDEAQRIADEQERRERIEAELAAEAERRARQDAGRLELDAPSRVDLVGLEAERAEHAQHELQRQAAERAEAQRLEAERIEAERIAAEEALAVRREAERIAADRLAAEQQAEQEAAARVEAERLEAERREAERLEAERLEAERLEAERLEAERMAAEQAEAERLEAARRATEKAAADRIRAELAAEAERRALLAARQAQETAEREAAEQAAAQQAAVEHEAAEQAAAEQAAAESAEARRTASDQAAGNAAITAAVVAADPATPPITGMWATDRRTITLLLRELSRDADEQWAAAPAPAAVAVDVLDAPAPVDAAEVPATVAAIPTPLPEALDAPAWSPAPELEQAPGLERPETRTEPEAEPQTQPDHQPAEASADPAAEWTDTASLLRELSSLGTEEARADERPPTPLPSRPAPRHTAPAPKKRRGLFGRG